MSIQISNISKFYGKQKALDNISLNVGKGEIVGLLGPNGAGKSTIMKILTCFIPKSGGQAVVNGFDIEKKPNQVRKSIGYLPETNPLYLNMYVKEYIRFSANMYGLTKNLNKKIAEMIALTGLEAEKHKKIKMLSKGYRQRVGLATAIIHNPDVLILDEPTSGLDPNQIVEIRNLIKSLGKEKTVLLSTHIMQEVEAICQRIVIVNKGQIVADTEVSKLKSILKESIEKWKMELESALPIKLFKDIPEIIAVASVDQKTIVLDIKPEKAKVARQKIMKLLVEKDTTLLSLKKVELSVEELFQKLTKN